MIGARLVWEERGASLKTWEDRGEECRGPGRTRVAGDREDRGGPEGTGERTGSGGQLAAPVTDIDRRQPRRLKLTLATAHRGHGPAGICAINPWRRRRQRRLGAAGSGQLKRHCWQTELTGIRTADWKNIGREALFD